MSKNSERFCVGINVCVGFFCNMRETSMRKYLIVFFGVAMLSALTAHAFDEKACYKRCMEKVDDRAKCEKICKED